MFQQMYMALFLLLFIIVSVSVVFAHVYTVAYRLKLTVLFSVIVFINMLAVMFTIVMPPSDSAMIFYFTTELAVFTIHLGYFYNIQYMYKLLPCIFATPCTACSCDRQNNNAPKR